jgi:putative endonuclease
LSRERRYYVYILASKSRVLYVGVTGFLMPRVIQHKTGELAGFTQRYRVNRLVYYETFQYVDNAIARETEIKKRREKKIALISPSNPTWEDLAADWISPSSRTSTFLPLVRMKMTNDSPGRALYVNVCRSAPLKPLSFRTAPSKPLSFRTASAARNLLSSADGLTLHPDGPL